MTNIQVNQARPPYLSPYLSFHDWCMRQFELNPEVRPLTADQALRIDLDGYEAYLEQHERLPDLREFLNLRQELIAHDPRVYSRRVPQNGAVEGSFNHFGSLIDARRREDDIQLDPFAHYVWASGLGWDVPRHMQTAFTRSIETQAEEVRREFYGQPRRQVGGPAAWPFMVQGEPFEVPPAWFIRGHFYWLLDESLKISWMMGPNPVPGLLEPIILLLTDYVARETRCSEEEWINWDYRSSTSLEFIVAEGNLAEERRQEQENAMRAEYEDNDPEVVGEDDFWGPPPPRPRPGTPPPLSPRAFQNALRYLTAQEDLPQELEDMIIEDLGQSDSEDKDSHVQVLRGWFDPGNILSDRRPGGLGHPPHPWDIDHNDHRPYDRNHRHHHHHPRGRNEPRRRPRRRHRRRSHRHPPRQIQHGRWNR
ncbi:hypothetical protein BDZ45DRAFT_692812 [Acephala macrosclerotiorum]|nr:hypothetical protein BDZ45DRAFT_692812 [Acephala macrosclerotiorum]